MLFSNLRRHILDCQTISRCGYNCTLKNLSLITQVLINAGGGAACAVCTPPAVAIFAVTCLLFASSTSLWAMNLALYTPVLGHRGLGARVPSLENQRRAKGAEPSMWAISLLTNFTSTTLIAVKAWCVALCITLLMVLQASGKSCHANREASLTGFRCRKSSKEKSYTHSSTSGS